jgi:hypothetical protein
MADRDQSTSRATGILAVPALVAGAVILQQPPLIGSRPSATLPAMGLGARETVNARLWQDPFVAVRKHLDENKGSGTKAKNDQGQNGYDPGKLLKGFAPSSDVHLIVAMMTGGAYAGLEEYRRRQRYAIVSALDTAGFAPEDPERIGYLLSREKPPNRRLPEFVPFEWFFQETDDRNKKNWAAVLYFDEDVLDPNKPLAQLRGLIETVDPGLRRGRWSVIGPGSTDILRAMLREPAPNPKPSEGVRFFVSLATASDRQLTGTDEGVDQVFLEHCYELHRITSTDDELAKSLAKELELRGAWEKGETTKRRVGIATEKGTKTREAMAAALDKLPRVVLISEWDTLYGRRFAVDMRDALLHPLESEGAADREAICPAPGKPRTEYSKRCPVLHFSYFRGLDGQLPASAKKGASSAKQQEEDRESGNDRKDDKSKRTAVERPVGDSQVDYLRRLGQRLADVHSELRAEGKKGISAVGVLGSDLYDKLLVLQAARNALPDAVLFTTDLDAELLHPAELKLSTHNLVVASAFGLRLNDGLQAGHPPFRDTYETATYLAGLAALDKRYGESGTSHYAGLSSPRVFEIGRNSVVDLSEGGGGSTAQVCGSEGLVGCSDVHPPRTLPRIAESLTAQVTLFFLLTSSLLLFTFRQIKNTVSRVWVGATRSPPSVKALSVVVALGLVYLVYRSWEDVFHNAFGEPWAVANGVSMWPTQIMRLITWTLTCLLIRKGWRDIDDNNELLAKAFHLPKPAVGNAGSPHSVRGWFERIRRRIEPWKPDQDYWRKRPIAEIWQNHIQPAGFLDRILTLVVPVFLYIGASVVLFWALGFPVRPVRGRTVALIDSIILTLCVVSFAFLLFFVIEETRRCGSLVRLVTRSSHWPKDTLNRFGQRRCAGGDVALNDYLEDWLGIELIGRRTEMVTRLIYYPFLILTLLVLARNTIFDNWTFPPALVITLLAGLAIAITCALHLRSTAEKARRRTLDGLGEKLLIAQQADGRPLEPGADPHREGRELPRRRFLPVHPAAVAQGAADSDRQPERVADPGFPLGNGPVIAAKTDERSAWVAGARIRPGLTDAPTFHCPQRVYP